MAVVINHQHSAFVPERLIKDNVIVCFECMHLICSNTKNLTGFGVLKLYMSKAFDRVEWKFLEAIMIKMGFVEAFVKLIMRRISSVTYSICVNSSIYETLTPHRGFCQGLRSKSVISLKDVFKLMNGLLVNW